MHRVELKADNLKPPLVSDLVSVFLMHRVELKAGVTKRGKSPFLLSGFLMHRVELKAMCLYGECSKVSCS